MWTFLKRLLLIGSASSLAASAVAQVAKVEQALIVTTVGVPVTPKDVFAIQDDLKQAFAQLSVGEVDGNEIAVDSSEALIYMYGPDAEAMFAVALPILKSHPATASSRATLRFGDVSDKSARVELRMVNDPQWNQ